MTAPGSTIGDDRAGFVSLGLKTDPYGGIADVERHRQDPRLDVAVGWNVGQRHAPILTDVDRLQRSMPTVGLVITHKTIDKRLTRHQLNLWVERRANRKAALVKLLLAVPFLQLAADFFREEPGSNGIRRKHARIDDQRLGPRLIRLFGGDVAVLLHAADDVVAPLHGAVVIAERIQRTRLLRQSRQIGDFGDRQFVHGLIEIIERRGGDAVVGKAEINLVEVELENLLLRIRGLYSQG